MSGVRIFFTGVFLLVVAALPAADPPAQRNPKAALQAFNDLIGSWRGAGTPAGTREEQQRGFWTEKLTWEWQFKGKDAWLTVAFDKSKHFDKGTLRYVPESDTFAFAVVTPVKETLTFNGPLKNRVLTLQREDDRKKETQQLVITLLHANRFLYRYEVKPASKALFGKVYTVGATKEGVPFAAGDGQPECVVSGGLGTMPVVYKGQTYYVCCSGCRAEFKEDPEKYVKEYQQKKAKGR
jgi:hypothetical protein